MRQQSQRTIAVLIVNLFIVTPLDNILH